MSDHWTSDHRQANTRRAGAEHVDLVRGGLRKIDHAIVHERAAVVDTHVHTFAVGEIFDLHPGLKRKITMRGGELVHVVDLAGRGLTAVIRDAVPTRDARL